MAGNWSFFSRFNRSIGVIFSSRFSMSPCSKNSFAIISATFFCTAHGFVMAFTSQAVISMARKSSRFDSSLQDTAAADSSLSTSLRTRADFFLE